MVLHTQRDTVQAVNRTIRDFAEDPRIASDETWDFFCECGCFTLVQLSLDAFDLRDSVWAPGHEPEPSVSASQ